MEELNAVLNSVTAFVVAITALYARFANRRAKTVDQKMDAVKEELENGGAVKGQVKEALHEIEREGKHYGNQQQ